MLKEFKPWGAHALAAVALAAASSGVGAAGLPGGASSLTEVHGDWTVACVATDGNASCTILQRQVRGGDRQLVLSVELTVADNGRSASGRLVLPFGLRLDAGVLVEVDNAAPLPALRFSTCLPAGCVVPFEFHEDTTPVLQQGSNLQVTAVANDTGQHVKLTIPLAGLASAMARVSALAGEAGR